jgi:putative NADH-flavin reductase
MMENVPMKLLILGATGQVGRALVRQALERGCHVTALARSPQKLKVADAKLEVVEGSPLDAQALASVLAGKDAVFSTLGHTDLKPSDIVTVGARALIASMTRMGVKRLVIVSSTLVAPGGSFLTKIPRYLTRHPLNDSADMEKVIHVTTLDWTILRLVRLTNGGHSPYRIFEDEPATVSASISRSTVARCMLDLVREERYYRKTVGTCACPAMDRSARGVDASRSA